MRKKRKSLHKIIAALTVMLMLVTAFAGVIMIYMQNSSGRPKTIMDALKHDIKATRYAMERPSKADRLHSTIGPKINAPEKVADQPDAKKLPVSGSPRTAAPANLQEKLSILPLTTAHATLHRSFLMC